MNKSPQLVDACGSWITPDIVRFAVQYVSKVDRVYCRMHPTQKMALESHGITVTRVTTRKTWFSRIALRLAKRKVMKLAGEQTVAGIPVRLSMGMPENRIDFEQDGIVFVSIIHLAIPSAYSS